MVLVLQAADVLVPPSAEDRRTDAQKAFWKATHDRIEKFIPGFLEDVIPRAPPQRITIHGSVPSGTTTEAPPTTAAP